MKRRNFLAALAGGSALAVAAQPTFAGPVYKHSAFEPTGMTIRLSSWVDTDGNRHSRIEARFGGIPAMRPELACRIEA